MEYGTADITRITGVSFREVDYWVRSGVLRPSIADAAGSGTPRLFSRNDIEVIAAVAAARKHDLSLDWCRRHIVPHVRVHGLNGGVQDGPVMFMFHPVAIDLTATMAKEGAHDRCSA